MDMGEMDMGDMGSMDGGPESSTMFWGMTLTPGAKHQVELPQAATLSIGMASLGEKVADKAGRSVVMATRDTGEAYALCVLRAGATESVPLEVMIGTEDALSLSVVGSANEVHLTGNVEMQLGDEDDSDSDDVDGMNEKMLRTLTGGVGGSCGRWRRGRRRWGRVGRRRWPCQRGAPCAQGHPDGAEPGAPAGGPAAVCGWLGDVG